MARRLAVACAAGVAALAAFASTLSASTQSSHMLVGIYDEGVTLYDSTASSFATFRALHTQVIRLNLHWGGSPLGVAARRPFNPADPNDSAYNWAPYDRVVQLASTYHLQVLFSIIDTPAWANGGAGKNHAPKNMSDLRSFALAAATRYSGTWTSTTGARLPRRQALGRVERAEQPGLPLAAVQARPREVGDPERDRLRQDLRGGVHGCARRARERGQGGVRADRPAREQQPQRRARVRRPARRS